VDNWTYTLTFISKLAYANLPALTATGATGVTSQPSTITYGSGNEVETLTLSGNDRHVSRCPLQRRGRDGVCDVPDLGECSAQVGHPRPPQHDFRR